MSKTKQYTLIALLSAILVISKELFAFLPNIEFVSFFLLIYTQLLPLNIVISISIIFCFIQVILYGFGLWTPVYFVLWPSFTFLSYILKKQINTENKAAIYNALFGLTFGFFNSIPYFLMDFPFGWAGFLRGIPYDLIHCIGNYIIVIALYDKTKSLLTKHIPSL